MTIDKLSSLVGDTCKISSVRVLYLSQKSSQVIQLFEDSERCFELAVANQLKIEHTLGDVVCAGRIDVGYVYEEYAGHFNSKIQATRIAILKALLKVKKVKYE
jgi:hypothetical protein